MEALLLSTWFFLLPLGLLAITTALLGFLWRPLFTPLLAAGSGGIAWLGCTVVAGGPFGAWLLLSLLLATLAAMLGCVALRGAMEAGFAREAACLDMHEEDEA